MMTQLFNEGFPGDTTVELLARFERSVTAHHPDLVTLLVGGNDMFYPGHMIELTDFCKNLRLLIARIRALPAQLILMTPPPFYRAFLIENFPETIQHPLTVGERFDALCAAIRAIAWEEAVPLVELDLLIQPVNASAESLIMNEANSRRRDGMHLTAKGCQVVAQALYDTIEKQKLPHANVVCFGDSLTYGVYLYGKGTAHTDSETFPGQLRNLLEQHELEKLERR